MSRGPRHWIGILTAFTLVVVLWPGVVMACAVCYGDATNSGFVRGAQWATVLMIGVTYTMLVGGGVAFVVLRRRACRQAHRLTSDVEQPQ